MCVWRWGGRGGVHVCVSSPLGLIIRLEVKLRILILII